MKKDINIPKVENVYIAITKNEDDDLWNVNLVNDNDFELNTVLVVSKGYGDGKEAKQQTSTLRHAFEAVPAKASILVEPINQDVFHLFNEYWVSYFADGNLHDKKFIFPPDSLKEENETLIPLMGVKGVLHQ